MPQADFRLSHVLYQKKTLMVLGIAIASLVAGAYFWPATDKDSVASPVDSDEVNVYKVEMLSDLEQLPEQELDERLRELARERGLDGNPARNQSLPDIRTDPVAQLGRALFFSKSLSGNRDVACASCHHPLMKGFSSRFSGIHKMTWKALAKRLQEDARKQSDKHWLTLFQRAYGKPGSTSEALITIDRITLAIAEYQKSQNFTDNPWRSWLTGKGELPREAKIGATLFFTPGEQGGAACSSCHSGDFYTSESFANLAVPQFGRGKSVHNRDLGRYAITRKREDLFAFRVPSLLNVGETEPYGHNGAFNTLEGIIRHHLDPRASIASYDFSLQQLPQFRGLGVDYPEARQNTLEVLEALTESSTLSEFRLTEADKNSLSAYLTAFLHTLTDPCIKDSDCLKDWLPRPAPEDSHILNARIDRKFDNSQSRAGASKLPQSNDLSPAVLPELYPLPGARRECTKNSRALASKQQTFSFTDITDSSGIKVERKYTSDVGLKFSFFDDHYTRFLHSGGVASGDINGDCLNDVVISMGPDAAPEVFLNTAEGRFRKPPDNWGLGNARGMAGAMLTDLNGDGWLDLVAGSMTQNGEVHVYLNNRKDAFLRVAKTGIQASTPIGTRVRDVDSDGDMDLFLAEWSRIAGLEQEHLWLNNGQGLFQPGGRQFGLTGHIGERDYTFTPNFADLNSDGRADLILTSDFHMSQFFINDNGRQLKNQTDKRVINDENGMGSAFADFDNDGWLDIFHTTGYYFNAIDVSRVASKLGLTEEDYGQLMQLPTLAEFKNHLESHFGNSLPESYGKDDIKAFYDEVKGYRATKKTFDQFGGQLPRLFMNNGDGTFQEQAFQRGLSYKKQGRGLACFDHDRDGDIDILVVNSLGNVSFYRNDLSGDNRHYLDIKLQGAAANTQAIGARIYLSTRSGTQMREVRIENNYVSHNPVESHFGLGSDREITELSIVWPDGSKQQIPPPEADRLIVIRQPEAP